MLGLKSDLATYPASRLYADEYRVKDLLFGNMGYNIKRLERAVVRGLGEVLLDMYLGDLQFILRSPDETGFYKYILWHYGFIGQI